MKMTHTHTTPDNRNLYARSRFLTHQVYTAPRLSPPHLRRPAVDALAAAPNLQPLNLDALHAGGIVQPCMTGHAAGVCSLLWHELQHRSQESGDALGLFLFEMVFLLEDVGERPVPQSVNVPQLAFAVEDLLAPLTAKAERAREGAK